MRAQKKHTKRKSLVENYNFKQKNKLILKLSFKEDMTQLKFDWRDELILVDPEQIAYIESSRNYSTLMLNNGDSKQVWTNLKHIEEAIKTQLGNLLELVENL